MKNAGKFYVTVKSLCLIAASLFIFSGCEKEKALYSETKVSEKLQGAADTNSGMQKLYALAKQEGKIVYWSATEVEREMQLAAEFNKTYPGIAINPFSIKPGNAVERIITESGTGRVSLDLLSTSIGSAAPLFERGLVAKFDGLEDMPDAVKHSLMVDGRYSNAYNLDYVIGYNTKVITPDMVPKNWEDLLSPKLKGKIAIEARAMPFGFLGLALGEKEMLAYIKKINLQRPFFVKGGNTIADQVASGEAPIALGLYSYQLDLLKKDGAPVAYTIPNPLGITNYGNVLIKGAAHPNAAKLYAVWMASDEGQKAQQKVMGRGSLLPDSPLAQAKAIRNSGSSITYEDMTNYIKRKEMEAVAAKSLGITK
jgi:iron(III) transport system substrate-binding protein